MWNTTIAVGDRKEASGSPPVPRIPFRRSSTESFRRRRRLVDLERVAGFELALLEKTRSQVPEVRFRLESFELDSRDFQPGKEPEENGHLAAIVARGGRLDLDVAEYAEGEELLNRAAHGLRTVRLAGRSSMSSRLASGAASRMLQPDFADDAPAIALGSAGASWPAQPEARARHLKLFRNFTSTMSPSSSRDRIQDIGPRGVLDQMIASVVAFRLVE
jgi:hypothetical protein